MKAFTAMYGIKITDANPEGSSANEISAINELKGKSTAPDVVDVGSSFAVSGDASGLWAPYKVATWNDIPAAAKAANGDYYADYGGYVAIGYDPSKVKTPPTSFKSLLNPIYKNQVAIDGDPTQTGSAFAAVYAAALANGGSLSNIAPGVAYFKQLKSVGNFVPTEGTPATVQSGATPILVWWDYLLASEVRAGRQGLQGRHPERRPVRRLLRPGDQRDRARPGRRPAVGGVPLLHPGPEPLPRRRDPADRDERDDLGRHDQQDRGGGASARSRAAAALDLPTTAQNTAAESVVTQQWPSVSG